MGVTSAIFQISENVPDVNESLIKVVKVGDNFRIGAYLFIHAVSYRSLESG